MTTNRQLEFHERSSPQEDSFSPDSFSVLPATCFCRENAWICKGKWEDITQIVFLSLPPTTPDICSPLPPQLLLGVSPAFFTPPSFALIFPLLQCSFLSLHLYMRFRGYPQRSFCTHILWQQCAGDNEVSGKRGLGGVVGIIPAVKTLISP